MLCGSTAWARRTTDAVSVCVFSPPLLYVHSGEEQGGGRAGFGLFYVALKQSLHCASPRLQVDDATAASAISQTGYKQSTWWEDDADGRDLSADWRS